MCYEVMMRDSISGLCCQPYVPANHAVCLQSVAWARMARTAAVSVGVGKVRTAVCVMMGVTLWTGVGARRGGRGTGVTRTWMSVTPRTCSRSASPGVPSARTMTGGTGVSVPLVTHTPTRPPTLVSVQVQCSHPVFVVPLACISRLMGILAHDLNLGTM